MRTSVFEVEIVDAPLRHTLSNQMVLDHVHERGLAHLASPHQEDDLRLIDEFKDCGEKFSSIHAF
jgi:hypothetical protein